MITHAEVRAVAVGKLDLPTTGVLWDVGAGSGSVAAECHRLLEDQLAPHDESFLHVVKPDRRVA